MIRTHPPGLVAPYPSRGFPVISTSSPEAMGDLINPANALGLSTAWPVANKAIFVPFELYETATFVKIGWVNGGAVSGHVDAGIYSLAGARLVSTGSTLQAGTKSLQTVTISVTLGPGNYYMALAMDGTTGTNFRWGNSLAIYNQMAGIQEMATAFVLPSTATFANPAAAYAPKIYIGMNATL
jgi:hypothetical protein